MISYTDLYNAEYWNNYCLSGEKKLTEKIKDEISVLFNKKIPDPLEYKFYYWKEGVICGKQILIWISCIIKY